MEEAMIWWDSTPLRQPPSICQHSWCTIEDLVSRLATLLYLGLTARPGSTKVHTHELLPSWNPLWLV